ncbi:Signal transduction histidine kinase [Hyella patelloides LEGE 07179]|uniref:Circadian input-output histidine kinase CikA n=1 Tax=Hyella patelloides LEGE 07179 TaxID=945734 RepID=A0A563VK48_9CYAN|nr:HAMP domain-containing sensor histidine kinase [Hyella patelloides]VEP11866.1 Signal transduction histidine kinase [Hyella patelloides LEGE 07179]
MSNTGLTLQLGKKPDAFCDAHHLLIVTDNNPVFLQEIEQVLQQMTVELNCHSVTCDRYSQALSEYQYDLILYNYCSNNNSNSYYPESTHDYSVSHPIPELAWWYDSSPRIPLVLITEPLGDEMAIACIQSGINAYVLRHKLSSLPDILETRLVSCIQQQSQTFKKLSQQINLLKQEIIKLKNQNSELKTADNSTNQEYFAHLNHDLRSPLANILQFARMLKDEIYGKLNPKQTEYIAGILTSGNHLYELINDYLDIAKIEANHEELYPDKVPVEDVCDASLVMVQGKAKEKELELIIDIADDIDFCYADSLRLKQILINLLSNAVKFTEQGSVTLQVKATSKMLLFSIIDTGIGISKEDSAKLFQPFQQINTPLHRQHKGTGLGLALSRKLAQLHGGDITLTSEVGKGSCFTVSIPAL